MQRKNIPGMKIIRKNITERLPNYNNRKPVRASYLEVPFSLIL
jgi:hypothetical protein